METERAKRLAGFVSWVGANIKGDEKGEAQVFLDRFFQAFGHAGLKEAGATLEEQIKKADGKGTAFADLVWKPVVLIEMKKRGEGVENVSGNENGFLRPMCPISVADTNGTRGNGVINEAGCWD